MRNLIFLLPLIFLLGCDEVATGPVEVRWDRDTCERCRMVLSDRLHSAQVRGGPVGQKSRVYKFDDIGGAILWLQDKKWKDHKNTEIWVNDHRNGNWINARQSWFLQGQITPMEFGLGAQDSKTENAMTFNEAVEYIIQREKRFNQPGADLKGQMHEHHHHH